MLKLHDSNVVHLKFLTQSNENVLVDFCKLSWDYIAKGANLKFYNLAAQKLGIEPKAVQHVVEALSNLLVESCKHKISAPKLKEILISLEFNNELSEILCNFYNLKQSDIRQILSYGSVQLPTFQDLEWRVEAQIGTRALTQQIKPNVLLRLKLENSTEGDLLLKTDPGNLVHITKTLEAALQEATSQHSRRVQRRFKSNLIK